MHIALLNLDITTTMLGVLLLTF